VYDLGDVGGVQCVCGDDLKGQMVTKFVA